MAKTDELKVVSNDPVELIDNKSDTARTDEKVPGTEEVPIDDVEEDEAAPPQPPRPIDPITRITTELKDAFPGIDEKYITAVLIASQGEVDPAFNALLYISDPSFKPEIPEPSLSAPKGPPSPISRKGTTLTDDELLARKLQKEFELEDERRRRKDKRKHVKQQPEENESGDDFEQIKETFSQGLEEARTTLNGWVSGIAKKFDGGNNSDQSQKQNPKLFGALGGSSFNSNDNKRKSNRFDEDPQILSNDFNNRISLTDNDNNKDLPHVPQRTGSNNSKKTPISASQSDTPTIGADTKTKANAKWLPLNSDVPANSDTFLVSDSEDDDTGVANYDVKAKK